MKKLLFLFALLISSTLYAFPGSVYTNINEGWLVVGQTEDFMASENLYLPANVKYFKGITCKTVDGAKQKAVNVKWTVNTNTDPWVYVFDGTSFNTHQIQPGRTDIYKVVIHAHLDEPRYGQGVYFIWCFSWDH